MAISSPSPQTEALRILPQRFVVWLGPEDGTAPSEDNEVDYLDVLSISRSAGGSRVDSISLRYNLAKADIHLQDVGIPVSYHRQIEVRRLDEDGDPTIIEAWGFISSIDQGLGGEESLTITARLDPFVFGNQLEFIRYWDADAEALLELHRPCVFNPRIDEKIEGNRSDYQDPESDDSYVFVDVESMRTLDARTTQMQLRARWTAAKAIHAICWWLNPDETNILNPKIEELDDVFASVGSDEFANVELSYGGYLPTLLDAMLRPIGFGWYLEHSLNADDERETRIRFYERGEGEEVELLMQRFEVPLDARKFNVIDLRASVDIASLANRIVARGATKRYEVTVKLVPGWKSDDDETSGAALEFEEETLRDSPHIARKFVLNEAGDYTDPYRTDVASFYDLRDLLTPADADTPDQVLIVRRRFHPCITRASEAEDAESLGYHLEWWDRDIEGATDPNTIDDPGWSRVKESFSVLDKECGVLFSKPHHKFWQLHQEGLGTPPEGVDHPGLFLRMTACIDGDLRLEAVADREDTSPNGETISVMLDVGDKFQFREVHADSRFYADRETRADKVDDTTKLQDYADRVRSIEDSIVLTCSVTMPGCDHVEFDIGKLITKLSGREINLNAGTDDSPRPLQIVGLNRSYDGTQRMELLLETFEEERPVI